jgi:hypothetical protein
MTLLPLRRLLALHLLEHPARTPIPVEDVSATVEPASLCRDAHLAAAYAIGRLCSLGEERRRLSEAHCRAASWCDAAQRALDEGQA